jgi:Reverse transcriptase (RNA-dependent DNA polymerase)
MRSWNVVTQEPWMHVLPSTWAFRCKRYPDGSIRKLKARFCARGDKQIEGVDYFDTFAPVVNWTTVRLMLVLSIILKLLVATKQVDYTTAFVADIDRDRNWDKMTEEEQKRSGVYVRMPRGFSQPGKVLKLNKSLYGLKQAPCATEYLSTP